jgi:hypothetical protein
MATFTVNIINRTTPALSVGVETAGSSQSSGQNITPVTYSQLKNSLGQQCYKVNGFYLYSTNANQLNSVIKYSIFDSGGNQDIASVVTQIDPFQAIPSLLVDLQTFNKEIILNGNSNVNFTILPFTTIQLKFLSERVSNAFGLNYTNFEMIQEATNTEFFKDTYGSKLQSIIKTNREIRNNLDMPIETRSDLEIEQLLTSREGKPIMMENGIAHMHQNPFNIESKPIVKPAFKPIVKYKSEDNYLPLLLITMAGASYLVYNKYKK